MPQMSPINWTIMFLLFLTILLVMASKLFFSIINTKLSNSTQAFINPNSFLKWEW